MSPVIDAIAPPRFGTGFRRLLASSWASDLGDGVALAAGPLLVVSQTRDPFLIALATLLQRLPWHVLGLHAGVIADRYDRRRIIVVANSVRAVVLAVLATMIVSDTLTEIRPEVAADVYDRGIMSVEDSRGASMQRYGWLLCVACVMLLL